MFKRMLEFMFAAELALLMWRLMKIIVGGLLIFFAVRATVGWPLVLAMVNNATTQGRALLGASLAR
jgi:hypothetical protein